MGNRHARKLAKWEAREEQRRQQLAANWDNAKTKPRLPMDTPCLWDSGVHVLTLVYSPSFDPGYSWDIRCNDDVYTAFFSSRISEQQSEVIGYEQLEIRSAVLHDYYTRLCAAPISIGPLPSLNYAGADGTTYELFLQGGLYSFVHFNWWSSYPRTWKPIVDIADELIAFFLKMNPGIEYDSEARAIPHDES